MLVDDLLEALGLPHVGVQRRAVIERVDALLDALRVLVHDQVEAVLGGCVAELVHRLELPRRVDVHQRERRLRRVERLERQVQHHRAVLADRVQHRRSLRLRHRLAHDLDRLGLEPLQVGQPPGGQLSRGCRLRSSSSWSFASSIVDSLPTRWRIVGSRVPSTSTGQDALKSSSHARSTGAQRASSAEDRSDGVDHLVVEAAVGGDDAAVGLNRAPCEKSSGAPVTSVTTPPACSTTNLPAAWSQIFST